MRKSMGSQRVLKPNSVRIQNLYNTNFVSISTNSCLISTPPKVFSSIAGFTSSFTTSFTSGFFSSTGAFDGIWEGGGWDGCICDGVCSPVAGIGA